MNPNLQSEVDPDRQRKADIFGRALWFFNGYFAVSILTLPFLWHFWWGDGPILSLIQFPKIELATWLRIHVVMKAIKLVGLSRGSFSPDFLLARPYGLALAYLIPIVIFGIIILRRFDLFDRRRGFAVATFLVLVVIDYVLTLVFGRVRGITMY